MTYCQRDADGVCVRCGHAAKRLPHYRHCGVVPFDGRDQHHGINALFRSPPSGPGTELKSLLARIGIKAAPNCSCNARARLMDERGVDWCEANLEEIVGWLREEATKRGLPFVDMAGKLLVRRAIANARREEARRAKEAASQTEGGPPAV